MHSNPERITFDSELLPHTHGWSSLMEGRVQQERRRSCSSCITELKSINTGIKAIQYLCHLMKQLDLSNVNYLTPLYNDNQ